MFVYNFKNIHEIKTKTLAQSVWCSCKNNLSKQEENNEYYIFKLINMTLNYIKMSFFYFDNNRWWH